MPIAKSEPRRSQVIVSPEVQALIRLVALIRPQDLETARVMVTARMSEHRASTALLCGPGAIRQRIVRLVERVESEFPNFRFHRGAVTPRVMSFEEVPEGEGANGH